MTYRKIKRTDFGDNSSGITVTFYPKYNNISISGHYDSFVGIEGANLTLREFFDIVGITEKDCSKAFEDASRTHQNALGAI